MRPIFPRLLFLLCLAPPALLHGAPEENLAWEVLEGCQLVDSGLNDGDSFLVRHGDQEAVFRLYYVDAPEAHATYRDRIHDQARYFSIPEDAVTTAGAQAGRFTQRFLRGEFTVLTRWEDARGSGKRPRYFALVRKNADYLSMELAAHGLARIYGMPTKERWPGGFAPRAYLGRLKQVEREAQRGKTGIWAIAAGSEQMAGLEQIGPPAPHSGPAPAPGSAGSRSGQINLNTASSRELESISGIGQVLAARILAARPIDSIDALADIPGISAGMVAEFRNQVIVEEPPPPPRTADFYLDDKAQYLNNDVTVRVASVAVSKEPAPDGFRAVHLETANHGKDGGGIVAFVPEEFYDSFLRYYGESGREFTGLLHERGSEVVLVYRRQ